MVLMLARHRNLHKLAGMTENELAGPTGGSMRPYDMLTIKCWYLSRFVSTSGRMFDAQTWAHSCYAGIEASQASKP